MTAFAAGAAGNAQADTVLVLGDSISAGYGIQRDQGWVDLLSRRLAATVPPHAVVNASISGDTTGGGLVRLPNLLQRHRPAVVLIELGGNDGLRGYPTARMGANITKMVQLAQQSGARVILVAMEIPPNYGARYTTAFRNVYRDAAQAHNVPLVPFLLGGVALDSSLMQPDGIHPTTAAQPKLLETAWPSVRAALAVPTPAPARNNVGVPGPTLMRPPIR